MGFVGQGKSQPSPVTDETGMKPVPKTLLLQCRNPRKLTMSMAIKTLMHCQKHSEMKYIFLFRVAVLFTSEQLGY